MLTKKAKNFINNLIDIKIKNALDKMKIEDISDVAVNHSELQDGSILFFDTHNDVWTIERN